MASYGPSILHRAASRGRLACNSLRHAALLLPLLLLPLPLVQQIDFFWLLEQRQRVLPR